MNECWEGDREAGWGGARPSPSEVAWRDARGAGGSCDTACQGLMGTGIPKGGLGTGYVGSR